MGVTMSDQRAQAAGLFVTKDLQACATHLASNTDRIDDFIQYIKDGSWIDLLADPNFFQMQTRGGKLRLVPATFYSGSAIPVSPLRTKALMQGTHSVRTSSASTRDSCQSTMENFKEFYADLQERTCFQPDQLAAFLISIVHSLYDQTGERKAITESDALFDMNTMDSYSYDAAENAEANPDIALLQEMLLSVAAYFDGRDLFDKLISQEWLRTLDQAVNECSLDVCICEVQDGGKLLPVMINNVARKRIQALHRSCKNLDAPDFLHLWSIEHEDILQDELQRCIANAIPVQLFAVHALNHCRTTLNLVHVFDAAGRHKYVLGVQMDVPEDGRSVKHLQYLRDTALMIAHVIQFSPPAAGATAALAQENSPATVTRKFST